MNCSTCGNDVKIKSNGHVNITRVTTATRSPARWMEVCQNQTSVGYQYDGGFEGRA